MLRQSSFPGIFLYDSIINYLITRYNFKQIHQNRQSLQNLKQWILKYWILDIQIQIDSIFSPATADTGFGFEADEAETLEAETGGAGVVVRAGVALEETSRPARILCKSKTSNH